MLLKKISSHFNSTVVYGIYLYPVKHSPIGSLIFVKVLFFIILLILNVRIAYAANNCGGYFKDYSIIDVLKSKYNIEEAQKQSDAEDYFYTHPPLQPKRDIANYVASQGILTPRRFNSLTSAFKSGSSFIIRSEHPIEYFGPSGLGKSFVINKDTIELINNYLRKNDFSIDWDLVIKVLSGTITTENPLWKENHASNALPRLIAGYFNQYYSKTEFFSGLKKLADKDFRDYESLHSDLIFSYSDQLSFSFWEHLPGINRSIIADSALHGVYHIFSTNYSKQGFIEWHNYIKWDNGKVNFYGSGNPAEIQIDLLKVIGMYEQIRNLSRFDSKHAPLMEIQSYNNKNYFLQYHRTRGSETPTFTLTRPLGKNEIEASFVRGATGPDGIIVNTTLTENSKFDPVDEASFDLHLFALYTEVISRVRKVNFIDKDLDEVAIYSADKGHFLRSTLFKPKLSIGINSEQLESLFPEGELDRILDLSLKSNSLFQIQIRVISDGKKAYIKIVDPSITFD